MNQNTNRSTAYVITLTGPSGSGKSQIINILREIGLYGGYDFHPIMIPKYTTRAFREKELEYVNGNQFDELDIRAVYGKNNIVTGSDGVPLLDDKQMEIRKRAFKKLNCDLVYEQYGNQYGIHFSKIYEYLKQGKSPIIILNDVRTVEDIRTFMGEQCISLFVFRKVPEKNDFHHIGLERKTSIKETETRFDKANAIYRIYIENIQLFDKLILNTQNGYDSLYSLLKQLVAAMCEKRQMFLEEK